MSSVGPWLISPSGKKNGSDIQIHFQRPRVRSGPVVLIHGYPLNGNSLERQERVLLAAGYRGISYDRRGFGKSSQPTAGYDYDTFAADLKRCSTTSTSTTSSWCGFSMGTGEVTRYLGTYGSARVRKAALFGAIPPFLLKTDDNPRASPGGLRGDQGSHRGRPLRLLRGLLRQLLQRRRTAPNRISDQRCGPASTSRPGASPYATYACVDTWLTDFRCDLPKIDVPTLVVHGTADRILPFEATAARLRDEKLIADLTVVEVPDGPHNIGWTHPDEVNAAFLDFLAR